MALYGQQRCHSRSPADRGGLHHLLHHVKEDGVIAVHVSNRYLDLAPVVHQIAARTGAKSVVIDDDWGERGRATSRWVLVAKRPDVLDRPAIRFRARTPIANGARAWTDDYANLLAALELNMTSGSLTVVEPGEADHPTGGTERTARLGPSR